jgi:hypothetical protein
MELASDLGINFRRAGACEKFCVQRDLKLLTTRSVDVRLDPSELRCRRANVHLNDTDMRFCSPSAVNDARCGCKALLKFPSEVSLG